MTLSFRPHPAAGPTPAPLEVRLLASLGPDARARLGVRLPQRAADADGPVGMARERSGLYDADDPGPEEPDVPAGHDAPREPAEIPTGVADGEVGPSLRDAIAVAGRAVDEVVRLAADDSRPGGGELGGLLELLGIADQVQAVAVELAGQSERACLAERRTAQSLEQLLAFRSRLTYGDRRMLTSTADILRHLPNIRHAFLAGQLGWAEVRQITIEARPLNLTERAELDAAFDDTGWLTRREPDRVVDDIRARVARLRPAHDKARTARQIERRFLALQPMLGGTGGTGYFELDDEAFATVAAGLQAAMPPPSAGPNDVTRHAVGHADQDDADDPDGPDGPDTTTPDGLPGFADRITHRSRARQRADALVTLAETFLAGTRTDGTTRRARPTMLITADINDLTGHSQAATAARLLTHTLGPNPHLTVEAAKRLSEDADLRLIIKHNGQYVGVSAPTNTIPTKARALVTARDQGCRFPGCRMPVAFTDIHHVTPREHGGHTIVSNLVCLCRRHHIAVHEGGWKLHLHHHGAVTIRRGRITHTSDPP